MWIENLDFFFQNEFSDRAVNLNNAAYVWGIFDNRFEPIFDEYGAGTSGRSTTFLIKSADAGVVKVGDVLRIGERSQEDETAPSQGAARYVRQDYEILQILPRSDGKISELVLRQKL